MADKNLHPLISTISDQQRNYESQRQLDFRLTNPDTLKVESPLGRKTSSTDIESRHVQLEPAFSAHT
jgi:hypothetical protein